MAIEEPEKDVVQPVLEDANNQPEDVEKATRTVTAQSEAEVYSIYTHRQKVLIIVMATLLAVFSPSASSIYVPALNSVASSLHVSSSDINLTLTTFLIFQGIAPTFIGGFSDSAGRRPAYIICLIIFLGANIGLALTPNYAALLVFRAIQSCGSSPTIALANAVAADVVTSAERGRYVGYTSLTAILSPSVAPILGGVLSQYAGWRWIFWFLTILTVVEFTPFLLFFPETGRKIVGNGSIPPPPLNHSLPSYLKERRLKKEGRFDLFEERDRLLKARKIQFPNPMDTLRIIFTKIAGILLLTNGLLFCCYYSVTASLPSQLKASYGYNDLEVSLMFLPFAGGGTFSAFTTGRLIDWNFRRHCRRLGIPVVKNKQTDLSNFPIERARLEVAIPLIAFGSGALMGYGWTIHEGVSIAAPCIFLFIVGFTITAGFNCNNILMVDMYPGKPATATAANNLVRCEMGAGAAALVVPLTNAVGFGWTATIASSLWFLTVPALIYLERNGMRWRQETREKHEKQKALEEQKKGVEDNDKVDEKADEKPPSTNALNSPLARSQEDVKEQIDEIKEKESKV